jgi:hypothetical protein
LDLIIIMDRSDSMNWWSTDCTTVVRAGNVSVPQATNCWQLWVLFTQRLVSELQLQNPRLQWDDNGGGALCPPFAAAPCD